VSVRLEGVESMLRVEVHNAGVPIPEPLRAHLFEPFHRSESGPGRVARGGLGLGLYIVAQIVQAHGGRIEVDSSVDQGTSFVVLLPRSVPAPGGTVEDDRAKQSLEQRNAAVG
jgi:signal transduction histidine kinase